jgi:mono/diheme cytochrome c family protein
MATPSPSASTPTESTNTHSAQVAAGERLYATQCARCHEQDGGIGIRLRRGILLAYVTPARLFRYIQARMPYDTDFRLSDEEYWAITAYLLVRSDLIEAEPPLEPLSAEEIRLQR